MLEKKMGRKNEEKGKEKGIGKEKTNEYGKQNIQ